MICTRIAELENHEKIPVPTAIFNVVRCRGSSAPDNYARFRDDAYEIMAQSGDDKILMYYDEIKY